MTKNKRGPKKGKRVTLEMQTQMIYEALNSKKTIVEIINKYKQSGFNFKSSVEEELTQISNHQIAFMLSSKSLIQSVKEAAINTFIKEIRSK